MISLVLVTLSYGGRSLPQQRTEGQNTQECVYIWLWGSYDSFHLCDSCNK